MGGTARYSNVDFQHGGSVLRGGGGVADNAVWFILLFIGLVVLSMIKQRDKPPAELQCGDSWRLNFLSERTLHLSSVRNDIKTGNGLWQNI